ncbi:MAG: M15 family metallopeptidase [Pseudomonadota bacterium]
MRIITLSILLLVFELLSFSNAFAQTNAIEKKFREAGLIDIHTIDSSIRVDLVNSDPEKNYFRENFYDSLNKAYLRNDVAVRLSNAQSLLKSKYPGFSLLVLDAARPRSVSKLMYEKMKGTKFEKYVANPTKGSMHNYGIAVDITIVDENGEEIDMGFSPFRKSAFELYWQFAKINMGFKISKEQKKNRKILSDTMINEGFLPLSHEWWHFNGMQKDKARKRFSIIE